MYSVYWHWQSLHYETKVGPLDVVCERRLQNKRDFWKKFANFQVVFVTWRRRHRENKKFVRWNSFFMYFPKIKFLLTQHLEKVLLSLILSSKIKNERLENNFFFLCLLASGKGTRYDFHRVYRRVLPLCNAKAPTIALERVPPTTDAANISLTPQLFYF